MIAGAGRVKNVADEPGARPVVAMPANVLPEEAASADAGSGDGANGAWGQLGDAAVHLADAGSEPKAIKILYQKFLKNWYSN